MYDFLSVAKVMLFFPSFSFVRFFVWPPSVFVKRLSCVSISFKRDRRAATERGRKKWKKEKSLQWNRCHTLVLTHGATECIEMAFSPFSFLSYAHNKVPYSCMNVASRVNLTENDMTLDFNEGGGGDILQCNENVEILQNDFISSKEGRKLQIRSFSLPSFLSFFVENRSFGSGVSQVSLGVTLH